jgi:hypothetical protein
MKNHTSPQRSVSTLLGLLLAAALSPVSPAHAELTDEQRKIPLEADSP